MHYPHRIRLRGPWECIPLARWAAEAGGPAALVSDRLPPPRRMNLPCRWGDGGLADFAGKVLFRRHFGCPSRLDSHERVWLTFAGVEGDATVMLNDQPLGEAAQGPAGLEWNITDRLRPRNLLAVEVVSATPNGGLWGEVALEIRQTAFLRQVRVWQEEGKWHAAGEIAGVSERPLELYVLLDGITALYTTSSAGDTFHFVIPGSESLDRQPREVGVDLIDGAHVWYRVRGRPGEVLLPSPAEE
ncbi:MAG: hypothetical protein NZ700_07870 [Gemmataceae bacterium]|nr:hypothetical protein [Gemmataceae bacterium]MDW8265625.1 hypothetical protein [Gemmataceae bacterium]